MSIPPFFDRKYILLAIGAVCLFFLIFYILGNADFFKVTYKTIVADNVVLAPTPKPLPPLDKFVYDKKLIQLANNGTSTIANATSTATSTVSLTQNLWPVKTVYPLAGAILPFNRIVAYYGNFYSTRMGALGEYPPDEMLQRLDVEVKKWQVADPTTPVIPALHYIAVTAQVSPGVDSKYRLRMPASQIDIAIELAKKINGLVFLDLQVGLSNLQTEIPLLEHYFKMPQVGLAIDPEFSMKTGAQPGTVIGTFDAADINYAATYLANLVRENNLPPKILIIHRFTWPMVTRYKQIKVLPEVQIVMDMDGWGSPAKKIDTYVGFIYAQPVQFTGFKLFYKNDLKPPSTQMLTPAQILKLKPQPSYIQYQ